MLFLGDADWGYRADPRATQADLRNMKGDREGPNVGTTDTNP